MTRDEILAKELTQGAVPLGIPAAYKFDIGMAEAAAAKAADAIRKIDSEGQIYVDRAAAQAAAAATSAEAAAKIVDVGVDPTLTVSDAAADAKVVGDRLVRDENKISGLTSNVDNLYSENRQQTDIMNQMKTSMELKSVGLTDNDGVNFVDMDSANINAFEYLPITDKTLSKRDVPADAAAVKEKLEFKYKDYTYLYGWDINGTETRIPILTVTGEIPTSKSDGKLDVDYTFSLHSLSGAGKLSIQGQTSQGFPKKNYNIKFEQNIMMADGWIPNKTYTLKGNFNDFSYARNTVNARLWGQCVRSRQSWAKDIISDYNGTTHILDNNGDAFNVWDLPIPGLVSGGATDGFPVYLVANGKYMGLYIMQLKKDEHMFWIGDSNTECIIGCEGAIGAQNSSVNFKRLAKIDDTDFTYEYCPDGQEDVMKSSFNRMIQACIDSTGVSYENTLGQYLDMDSIIDYMLFSSLICGIDIMTRNYLMVTYDGVKWYMSAYDLDGAYGSYQDGSLQQSVSGRPTPAIWDYTNRAMHLAYTYDKQRVKNRYDELRRSVFSEDNIYNMFLSFMRRIPLAAKIEETKLYPSTPSTDVMDLNQILNFYRLRVAYLDKEMEELV